MTCSDDESFYRIGKRFKSQTSKSLSKTLTLTSYINTMRVYRIARK